MGKKMTVRKAMIDHESMILTIHEHVSNMQATGRMLVDSEHAAFIYVLENEDGYHYVTIPEVVWLDVKQALQKVMKVYLSSTEGLELTQFSEEMKYLVRNIEGNMNYGEEMVKKVENTFLKDTKV